jgi:hypothetical protein
VLSCVCFALGLRLGCLLGISYNDKSAPVTGTQYVIYHAIHNSSTPLVSSRRRRSHLEGVSESNKVEQAQIEFCKIEEMEQVRKHDEVNFLYLSVGK